MTGSMDRERTFHEREILHPRTRLHNGKIPSEPDSDPRGMSSRAAAGLARGELD